MADAGDRGRALRFLRPILAVAGICLLAIAAWESGSRGIADWKSLRARHEIVGWFAKDRPAPTQEHWLQVVEGLRGELALAPRDPGLWEHLGLAYSVGSTLFSKGGQWRVYAEFALLHLRQATVLRPTSPYTWAGVAATKYALGEYDAEMDRALALAMYYGPWEPGVQMLVSDLGMLLWERLDFDQRVQVTANWARTADRQSEALAKLAMSRKRQTLLCNVSHETLKIQLKCPGR